MGTTAAFVHKTKPAGSPYGKDESQETPAREGGGGQGGTKNLSGFSALVLLQKNITVMQFISIEKWEAVEQLLCTC